MSTTPKPDAGGRTGGYKDSPLIPRIWEGMCLVPWVRLLARNRFRIRPTRIPIVLSVGGAGLFVNSPLWGIQQLLLGRKINQTEIAEPPIFVLGHWRTGTTLLHELLVRDPRHTCPTAYQCFSPNHFVISRSWLAPMMNLVAPKQRPQDDMPFGLNRPQEDEFALCNMGVPSPYLTMAFPNHPPQCREYLDMEGLSPEELDRWKRALEWFLKCVTLQTPKRIVLKSPPHLGRVRVLLELFPDARFIHIHRDPYTVFPSTMNLWKRFHRDQALQAATYEGLEEYIFDCFTLMYAAFERDRELIAPSRFSEVRYQSLVDDPIAQLERIYAELDLDDFDQVRPGVEQYMAAQSDYRPNRYEIPPETRSEIARRWGAYIEKYGYSSTSPETPPAQ